MNKMKKNDFLKKGGDPLTDVAIGVLCHEDRVLMELRHAQQSQGGKWAFPGGKIEAGEPPVAALIREFEEETGLITTHWEPLIRLRWSYDTGQVRLHVFISKHYRGTLKAKADQQQLVWMPRSQLTGLEMPEANRPVLNALRLPSRMAITGGFETPEALYDKVAALLSLHHHRLIQWRAPHLSRGTYLQHAKQMMPMVHRAGAKLLLNGDPSLLTYFSEADGLHLPSRYLAYLSQRPVPEHKLFGCAVHSAEALVEALSLSPDYVVLSPIQKTQTHPEAEALGWARAQALIEDYPVPVFALGGLQETDLALAKQHGFQGIAAISAWWPSET